MVRQYSQLIALMNNYDYFKENLGVAYGAEGTLEKQADIYAESWAAAEKRVKASMQGIYQSLIDDKFFIGINNALASALSGLDAFIDAAGGLPVILTTIGSIMLSVFANKIPDTLKNLQYNFDILFRPDKIEQSYKSIQEEMKNISDSVLQNTNGKGIDPNSSLGFQLQASNQLLEVRSRLARVNDDLSESEQRAYEQSVNDIASIQNKILSEKQEVEQLEKKIAIEKQQLAITQEMVAQRIASKVDTTTLSSVQGALRDKKDSFTDSQKKMKDVYEYALNAALKFDSNFSAVKNRLAKNYEELFKIMSYDATEGGQTKGKKYKVFNDDASKNMMAMVDQMAAVQKEFGGKKGTTNDRNNLLLKQLSALKQTVPKSIADVTGLSKAFEGLEKAMAKGSEPGVIKDNIETIRKLLENLTINGENADQVLRDLLGRDYANLELDVGLHQDNLDAIQSDMDNLQQIMDNFDPSHTIQGMEAIGVAGSALGNTYAIMQQVIGAIDSLGNPDLTGWEKFSAVIASLTTIVPTFITLMKNVGTITEWASQKQAILDGTYAASQAKMKVLSSLRAIESKQLTGQAAATEYKNLVEREGLNIDLEAIGANNVQNAQDREKIKNTITETAAEQAKNAVKKEGTIIQWTLNQLENKSKVLLVLGAIIAVVSAGIAIFKKFHKSTEEVNKAFEEANSAYKEQQTVVSDLESKLKELNNTIDELKNKGPLSLIEQEQLNKAETQKALLEQQLVIQNKILENRKKIAAENAYEKYKDSADWVEKVPTYTMQGIKIDQNESFEDFYAKNADKLVPVYTTDSKKAANLNESFIGSNGRNEFRDFFTELGEALGEEIPYAGYLPFTSFNERFNDDDIKSIVGKYFGNLAETSPDAIIEALSSGNITFYKTAPKSLEDIPEEEYSQWKKDYEEYQKAENKYLVENTKEFYQQLEDYQTYYDTWNAEQREVMRTQLALQRSQIFTSDTEMYDKLGINKYFGQSRNYEKAYKKMLSTDDVSEIVNYLDNDFKELLESMGFNVEDYIQYWVDRLQQIKVDFNNEIYNDDFFNELFNSKNWKPEYIKYIEQVLRDGSFTTIEEVFAELDRIIAESSDNIQGSLSSWKDSASKSMSIASKLKNIGDEISADEYASLGEEYRKYFDLQYDGTAILKTSAEEFYDIVKKGEEEKLKNQIDNTKNQLNSSSITNIMQAQGALDESNAQFQNNQSKLNQNKARIRSIKSSADYQLLSQHQDQIYFGVAERFHQYEQQIERLEAENNIIEKEQISLGEQIKNAQDIITSDNYSGEKENLIAEMEALASYATSIKQLDEYLSADYLDQNTYDKYYDTTLAKEASSLGQSYDQIKAYADYLGTLPENIGATSRELDKLALSFYTVSEGQQDFKSNWDKWDAAVKDGTQTIASNYLGKMQTALEHFLGTTEDLSSVLKPEFFIENWETIKKAIDGDTEAAADLLKIINEILATQRKGPISALDFAAMGGIPTATQETKTWRSGHDERSKIISGLTEDRNITADDYNKLLTEQQELFRVLDDGTYVLKDDLDSVKESLETLHAAEIEAAQKAGQNVGLVAESLQELDRMLSTGLIDKSQYADAFDTVYKKDISKYGFDKDEVDDYAETLQNVNEALADQPQLAKRIALEEKKQAKAVEDLGDNYEDYAKVLSEANKNQDIKNTEKYSKAIGNLRKNISLLTGIEEDAISQDFIDSEATQQALSDIANGVDGAVEKLRLMASMDQIQINLNLNEEELSTLYSQIEELNAQDIEIGAIINDAPALDALADLLNQTNMTGEQMQAIFNALGWDPEIEYVPVNVDTATALRSMGYQQYATLRPDGGYEVKPIPLSGEQSLAAGSQIYVPKIKSKSMGGGSYKKIDAPTPTLGNKKTSSGGGGGGSSKHAEKKNDSDKERYHTVLNQLEDLNAEYDDLSKAKDRAFGKDRLDYMDAEIKKTDELIAKQGEYLDEIKGYLPVDKAVMEAYYKDLINGPEMLFDEKGNISNFDAIQDAMYAKYNQMTEMYTDDDTNWEIFEKKYEQLEKYIEQYEETYDLLRDEEQKYQDLINQRIDAQLEKVQYKVEVKLDVSKDEIAVLEYQLGRINDDAFKSLDAIGLLFDKSMNLEKQIEINKQGLNDALGLSLSLAEISEVMAGNLSVLDGKNFTSDQIDAIKEYRDNLLDLNGELDDVRENIEEKVLDAFDAWNEKLNTGVEVLDNYGSMLEHFKNMIDIVGQDTLGLDEDFMNNLGQGTVDNAINKVRATKDIMESVMKAQEQAQKSLDEARAKGDQKSQEMWEDTLKQLDEEARSAQDTFLQAWEDALSGLADQFEQTVDRVVKNFNKSVYQVGGLEGLANDFSQQKDDSDMMLDDYQKIYELSKLSRDINKTIDDTDVISGKQKLKKLLEQVNDLQANGVEMSQYDLEYLQKTYDLRLAELELEEAQRAKNTVRLQKDNEGNWSYIYTQSSDAIDSAQQKYEDALYAMQDLSSNYIDEMSEKLINTSQEMADALAALRVEDFASLDDYYKEVERVQNLYQDRMALQEEELNKAIANNKELYDTDWTNYHNATGYKISDTENFATSFKDTLLGALMDSDTDSSNFTDLLGQSVQNLTAGLLGAAETYYKNLEEAMNAAGTSTSGFGEDVNEAIDQITAKSDEGAQAVEDMAERMNTAMNDVMSTVEEWQQIYGQAMEEIIQSNLEVIESFNEMIKALGADASNIKINYDITRGSSGAERFATGGYTGEWGSSGKLGILDEKELILNQSDTANMLSAIQLTREIINAIDIGANYASLGFGNLVATSLRDSNKETLEQNVHITAEFPNVNDHNEIELALKNLTNTASQYANRK